MGDRPTLIRTEYTVMHQYSDYIVLERDIWEGGDAEPTWRRLCEANSEGDAEAIRDAMRAQEAQRTDTRQQPASPGAVVDR